jgi:hypothetical protein
MHIARDEAGKFARSTTWIIIGLFALAAYVSAFGTSVFLLKAKEGTMLGPVSSVISDRG